MYHSAISLHLRPIIACVNVRRQQKGDLTAAKLSLLFIGIGREPTFFDPFLLLEQFKD